MQNQELKKFLSTKDGEDLIETFCLEMIYSVLVSVDT